MHFLGCSPKSSSKHKSSPRRPILFSLNATPTGKLPITSHESALDQPTLDNSRRIPADLLIVKSDEAQMLTTSLYEDHCTRTLASQRGANEAKHVWRGRKALMIHPSPPDSEEILTKSKNLLEKAAISTHIHPNERQRSSQNAAHSAHDTTTTTKPVQRFHQITTLTTGTKAKAVMHVPPPGPSSCLELYEEEEYLLNQMPQLNTHGVITSSTSAGLDKRMVADSLPRLRRSPSIAIKKVRQDPKAEAERAELANAVREYDWATWRLYDRIVSHRLRNQQVHPVQEQPSHLDFHGDSSKNVSADHDHQVFSTIRAASQDNYGQLDYKQPTEASCSSTTVEDGIFMMEL